MKDFMNNEFDALTEMNTLIRKLAIANIPFEVQGFPSGSESMRGSLQVCAPTVKECIIDIWSRARFA